MTRISTVQVYTCFAAADTRCYDNMLHATLLFLCSDNHKLKVYRIPSFVLLFLRIISQQSAGQLTELTAPYQQEKEGKSFETP